MMWGIGSKKSFTLIEVMMTVAVLSFGLVMLYHSFFISVDSAQYASSCLGAGIWMDNLLSRESERLLSTKTLIQGEENGFFELNGRKVNWQKTIQTIGAGLYAIQLTLNWKEAARSRSLAYSTYLLL